MESEYKLEISLLCWVGAILQRPAIAITTFREHYIPTYCYIWRPFLQLCLQKHWEPMSFRPGLIIGFIWYSYISWLHFTDHKEERSNISYGKFRGNSFLIYERSFIFCKSTGQSVNIVLYLLSGCSSVCLFPATTTLNLNELRIWLCIHVFIDFLTFLCDWFMKTGTGHVFRPVHWVSHEQKYGEKWWGSCYVTVRRMGGG